MTEMYQQAILFSSLLKFDLQASVSTYVMQYDMVLSIYMRSKADEMANLI